MKVDQMLQIIVNFINLRKLVLGEAVMSVWVKEMGRLGVWSCEDVKGVEGGGCEGWGRSLLTTNHRTVNVEESNSFMYIPTHSEVPLYTDIF